MTATMDVRRQRYTAVAIVLHWAIAFAIAFMIPLGFWMHEAVEHSNTIIAGNGAFQLHKSIGLTVLVLSLVRLAWRLANPPPPMPTHMPAWEKFAALATHWLFYALTIALPLTGWLYVSAGWSAHEDRALPVSTYWFHLFRVPALLDLPHAGDATRRAVALAAIKTHWALAWGTVSLAALHVAAALKHQFVDRDEVLSHMIPGLKAQNAPPPLAKDPARNAILGFGFAAIAVAAAFVFYAALNLGAAPAPAQAAVQTAPIIAQPSPSTPTTPTPRAQPAGRGGGVSLAAAGPPAAWNVNQAASSIRFTAIYFDDETPHSPFQGSVDRWRANIHFDPADLAHSSALITIDMSSVHDAIEAHNTTLRTEAWLDPSGHPTAEFRTTAIRHLSGDNYEARATLGLKGHALAITLPFTLTITGTHAVMDGHVSLDRTNADIGVRDPDGGGHIQHGIDVVVHVDASRS